MTGMDRLSGLFRRFRSFVLGREVMLKGKCQMCGNCCHDILLKDEGHWLRKEKEFKALCESDSRYERFIITGRDTYNHLTFRCALQRDDGLCTSYEDRLPLCRNYPAKSLYYQGGWIGSDCGFRFKSATFRDVLLRRKPLRMPQFSEVLQHELKVAGKRKST